MKLNRKGLSRREFVVGGSSLLAEVVAAGIPAQLLAKELAMLDIASAGSIRPMLEGPIKTSIAQRLKLDLHDHAAGADVVAQSIVSGNLRADVFIPITEGPMLTVMRAGKAEIAQPIACTEMVLVYSPKSRFTPQFEAAAKGQANWWEILQESGLRFVRSSNPASDPGARNGIFVTMLAAKKYKQANLVEKVFGAAASKEQAVSGASTLTRLQNGDLDAGFAYGISSRWTNLPFIVLSRDINLSGQHVAAKHPDVSLTLGGKTYRPDPLVYYAAVLKGAANPHGAAAFVDWLQGDEAQGLFRRYEFGPPGDASALHA